ncbi:ABC transporter ATP-binding protein [Nostoc sp. CMAA1605]|uniref:ABC transporter ATP-binding protein n=1 Tax=Nostoc sp. CMAA1605 TaxID=2055159 RepID=UPI001F17CBC0|nr:ABC transporter ATP-binding protein [Nostoc sp. CMAA1605]MCF4969548.1 ABC transporter ATP-binding protein [Nostoc sp. CMAA1605]
MLKLNNLNKSYGKSKILKDVNLLINSGEVYGLLGANGAGKTTIINIICNLLQADSGEITINHQSISQTTKSMIGVAPQENLLYKTLSCEENLNFFADIYGLNKVTRQQQVKAALTSVNLLDKAKQPVETLSGGMQRRLNIAVALVHQPKLVILDEPTTGLDIEARYEVWELIQNLKHQGVTVLMTTHLLDEAERLCDRIGILKEGRILVEGTLAELRNLIPAQAIVLIQTPTPEVAIARAQGYGFHYRYYGNQLAFWLPETLELSEIIEKFSGIAIESISRQNVGLEHIYLEVTKKS